MQFLLLILLLQRIRSECRLMRLYSNSSIDQSVNQIMSATLDATLEERWSQEHFDGMAELWKLTAEERAKMKTFQARISDVDHWKNDPYEAIRYLKEYKDLKKTEKMFRYMIHYRSEHDLDQFLVNYGEPDTLFQNMPIAILDGWDKEGDPIYLDRMGVADSWDLLKHFGIDAMIDYIIFIRELNNWRPFWKPYEDQVGHRVRNFTVIIDLEGLNSGHIRPGLLTLLQRTGRVSQDCYAGWAKRIFLIRAPAIFKMIWTIVRHFFDQHIQDLIVFTDHRDYLDVLQEHVDLEVLPHCIVGAEGKGKPLAGYFENVSLQGGRIPKPSERKQMHLKQIEHFEHSREEASVSSKTLYSNDSDAKNAISVKTKVMAKGHWGKEEIRVS